MWSRTKMVTASGMISYSDPTCIAGAKGDTGVQGPQGEKGDTGAQGPRVRKATPAPKAPLGPPGEKGNTGATGPAGADGQDGVGIKSIVEQYYLSTSPLPRLAVAGALLSQNGRQITTSGPDPTLLGMTAAPPSPPLCSPRPLNGANSNAQGGH